MINTHFVYIGVDVIVNRARAKVDVRSRMWNRLITATGQPRLNGNDEEEAKTESGSPTGRSALNTPHGSSGAMSAIEVTEAP
jgi:hypothetical protein